MEKIVVKITADGVELNPIDMRLGEEDRTYKEDMFFFSTGHAYNKEKTRVLYDYSIRLTRHKTREEKDHESKEGKVQN